MSESKPAQERGLSKSRIEALTDGVIAIAMTLMVFSIKVPEIPHVLAAGELWHELISLWPKLASYAISFLILGIYWVGHHNMYHSIRRADRVLLWLNVAFLMFLTLIPFSTVLLGQYPNQQVAAVIYAVNLIMVGLLLYSQWWCATEERRLVNHDLDPLLIKLATRRILTAPIVFLAAIGISFYSPRLSTLVYAAVAVLYIFPGRIDRHWRSGESRLRDNASAPAPARIPES